MSQGKDLCSRQHGQSLLAIGLVDDAYMIEYAQIHAPLQANERYSNGINTKHK